MCATFHCIWRSGICTLVNALKSKMATISMETKRGGKKKFSIFFHTDHNKCTKKWVGWKMSKTVFRPAPPLNRKVYVARVHSSGVYAEWKCYLSWSWQSIIRPGGRLFRKVRTRPCDSFLEGRACDNNWQNHCRSDEWMNECIAIEVHCIRNLKAKLWEWACHAPLSTWKNRLSSG